MAGENAKNEIQVLPMDTFHGQEGLKAPCPIEGCEGVVHARRNESTLELRPWAYCVLCAQEFTFSTFKTGLPLESALRGVPMEVGNG